MSYHVIQASEIADYIYCRKSWQLNRAGLSPKDSNRFIAGRDYHQEHYRQVHRSKRINKVALLLLFAAIALTTFWLVWAP